MSELASTLLDLASRNPAFANISAEEYISLPEELMTEDLESSSDEEGFQEESHREGAAGGAAGGEPGFEDDPDAEVSGRDVQLAPPITLKEAKKAAATLLTFLRENFERPGCAQDGDNVKNIISRLEKMAVSKGSRQSLICSYEINDGGASGP